MKKIFSIFIFCLPFFFAPVFTGCVEEVELVEELNLPACLTPSSASASISREDGHTVTFTWANSKGATQYVVEIYDGTDQYDADPEVLPETVFENGTLETSEIVAALESGSTTSLKLTLEVDRYYYARVKAQGMQADGVTRAIDDSKWQTFGYPIATYPVKDPVEKVEVSERKTKSVVIKWTMPENDIEVDRIRVTPNPDPNDSRAYKDYVFPEDFTVTGGDELTFEVGADAVAEGTAVALTPSTFYTFAVQYGNATRGEVTAWTRPDWSDAQDAPDVATLERLVGEAGDPNENTAAEPGGTIQPRKIRLTNADVDYEIVKLEIYGPVIIFGGTASGENPTVTGTFSMATLPGQAYEYAVPASTQLLAEDTPAAETKVSVTSSIGASYLRLEGLNLEGTADNGDCVSLNDKDDESGTEVSVEVVNCNLSGYLKSAFYNNKKVTLGDVLFDGCYFEEVNTGTQSTFDIRKAISVKSFTVRNTTITNGTRATASSPQFLRIDDAPTTVGDIVLDHNTLYDLGPGAGKSTGFFRVRADFTNFELTDNVIAKTDVALVYSGSKAPNTISSNFFYKIGETAWAPETVGETEVNEKGEGDLTQSAALAKGGAILNSDPFENAERGLFNIDNVLIEDAGAGDPRWLVPYVPEEVPPLTVTDYETTWDLTSVETFYDEIEDSTVRGNIEFFIVNNVVNVSDAGMDFTAEAVLSPDGTPSDGGIAFLVGGPGSVVLSTEQSRAGSANDHITVAYRTKGSTGNVFVEGAVPVGANGARVALPDIAAGTETMVYLYPCGPITLTGLSWIEDATSAGPSVLNTPANLALTADSGDNTAADVTLSWDEVPSAGSYKVIITGPRTTDVSEETVTTNSYSFKPSDLSTGIYTFKVQALIAEGDLNHENSEVSETSAQFEKTEAWTAVSTTGITSWGSEDFQYLYEIAGSDKLSRGYTYNNLNVCINKADKASFVTANNSSGVSAYAFSTGGAGSDDQLALQIKVSGPGTLTYEATSSGSSERPVAIYIGSDEYTSGTGYETNAFGTDKNKSGYRAPAKDSNNPSDAIRSFELSDISGETVISLTSNDGGIYFFSVTWTPAGYDPDAQIEGVKTESFTYDFGDVPDGDIIAPTEYENISPDVVLVGLSDAGTEEKHKLSFDGKLKTNGSSEVGDDGIPVTRYVTFKVNKSGKLEVAADVTSGTDRVLKIIGVDEAGTVTSIKEQILSTTKQSYSADVSVSGITTIYMFSGNGNIYIREFSYTIE